MKKPFDNIETFLIIIGSFAGLLLIALGLNLIIPYEKINPHLMVARGGIIIMITGAYAVSRKDSDYYG